VDNVSDLVDALLAKRFACDNEWRDGASKTAALRAIDEIIAEIREEGTASKWLAD
jgi:hypothetical protein